MKLFNKIAIASVGAALAFGVGVVSSKVEAKAANAADPAGTNTYTKITAISQLATGDSIVLFNDTSDLGVTGYSGSDATTSGTEDNWMRFTVTVSDSSFTAYSESLSKYVSANAANKFTIAAAESAAAPCFVTDAGVFGYTDSSSVARYLVTNGSYNRCYKSIGSYSPFKVYKVTEGGGDASTLQGVKLNKTFATGKKGTTVALELTPVPSTATDVTYSFTTSDATLASVDTSGSTATVTLSSANKGVVTITATATQGSTSFDKECKIAITDHEGTEADPLSITDAVNICNATGTSATTDKYYIEGVLAAELTVNGTGYNTTLTEDAATLTVFKVTNNYEGTINIGDAVTIQASLVLYGGTTPESQYGNVISARSLKTIDYVEIRGTLTFKTVTVGDDFDLTGLTVYVVYDDSSEVDVTSLATLECSPKTATVVGTTLITVTATFNEVDADPANFNVTVVAVVATVTDTITSSELDADSTSYSDTAAASVTSGAVYKANSAKATSKDNAIQMRSSNSNSGIVTTRTGGKRIKSVTINVQSGTNKVSVYASATAYAAVTDLYDSTKQGTALKTASGTYTVNFSGDYQYFGVRSDSGAIYLTSVEVVYELYTADEVAAEIKTLAGSWDNPVATADCAAHYARAKGLVLTLAADELETFKTSTDSEIANARQAYEFWCGANADATPYAGTIVSASKNVTIVDSYLNAVVIASVASVTLLGVALLILKKKKLAR